MNRETRTTPYLNFARRGVDILAFSEEYSQVCSLWHETGKKPVSFMKEKLGPQDYCFTGEYRYWVWENDVGWRIYVSNQKGLGFEVDATFAADQAKDAWFHFQELMGLARIPDGS